jgi:hypothetical protein
MKRRLALVAFVAVAAAILTSPAAAAQRTVTGTATGDWWSGDLYSTAPVVTTIDSGRFNEHAGVYHVTGTEKFTGCLVLPGADACGTLTLSFQAWGNYDREGNFVRGGCQHWIVGSGGDLAGASGFLTMQDRPATTYRGHIEL